MPTPLVPAPAGAAATEVEWSTVLCDRPLLLAALAVAEQRLASVGEGRVEEAEARVEAAARAAIAAAGPPGRADGAGSPHALLRALSCPRRSRSVLFAAAAAMAAAAEEGGASSRKAAPEAGSAPQLAPWFSPHRASPLPPCVALLRCACARVLARAAEAALAEAHAAATTAIRRALPWTARGDAPGGEQQEGRPAPCDAAGEHKRAQYAAVVCAARCGELILRLAEARREAQEAEAHLGAARAEAAAIAEALRERRAREELQVGSAGSREPAAVAAAAGVALDAQHGGQMAPPPRAVVSCVVGGSSRAVGT